MAEGIQLDSEAMRDIVQKAILDSLSPQSRDLVIADAVQKLTLRPELPKDPYNSYGKPTQYGPSPLEQAFQSAVREMAVEVVREYLIDVDVKAAVSAQLHAEIDRIIADGTGGDNYSGWLAQTIGDAMSREIRVKLEAV